jgi:hypothetical protein
VNLDRIINEEVKALHQFLGEKGTEAHTTVNVCGKLSSFMSGGVQIQL